MILNSRVFNVRCSKLCWASEVCNRGVKLSVICYVNCPHPKTMFEQTYASIFSPWYQPWNADFNKTFFIKEKEKKGEKFYICIKIYSHQKLCNICCTFRPLQQEANVYTLQCVLAEERFLLLVTGYCDMWIWISSPMPTSILVCVVLVG